MTLVLLALFIRRTGSATRRGHRQSLRTLVWNTRFEAGYKIGGFTQAKRDW
jgi:hypothetical protein